jgi:hypothetical protein
VIMVVFMVDGLLFWRGVMLMLLMGILDIDMRRGWWWLIMLTVKVAGFVAGWLADGDDISGCRLIFALDEILHNFGNSLSRLGGCRLHQRLAAVLNLVGDLGSYLCGLSAVVSIIDSPPSTHHFVEW